MLMKKWKVFLSVFLMEVIISISGIGSLKAEAANKGKYFVSGDICYKVIAKNEVAACGIKLKVDKDLTHHRWKSNTLQIPSYAVYKGKKYKNNNIIGYINVYRRGCFLWMSGFRKGYLCKKI